MNRSLSLPPALPTIAALAFAVSALAATPALAQQTGEMGQPAQCAQFPALNNATQIKADAVKAAMQNKTGDRKEICRLMTAFVASEGTVVKFLIDNKTWCGVPDQAVAAAKASHERSLKFRDVVCSDAPGPKAPSLSDAIKTAPVDSASNTNTKHGGTFDTLTGNPLGH